MTTQSKDASITASITENRPNLASSSIRTYKSILNNLYRRISGKQNEPTTSWFADEQKDIIKFLEEAPLNSRKLHFSALSVLLEKSDPYKSIIYRNLMNGDIMKYNKDQREQKKTDKQEQNWISQDEVEKIWKSLGEKTRPLLVGKRPLTKSEHSLVQDYVMLSLFVLQPPRRSQDYCDFKLHDAPTDNENGIIKKGRKTVFVFNKYKTAKTYGKQEVEINPQMLKIINFWKKLNPTQEWLLILQNGKKMEPNEMTRRFNNIFGKRISVSMLRHIYISDRVLPQMPKLTDMEEQAREMGQSVQTQILYKKE